MSNLKQILQQVRDNNYAIPNDPTVEDLTLAMINNIGAIDSELRDELIYSTFSQWILGKKLSTELVKQVLFKALDDEHLFYELGDSNTDTVFTRSFSILLIPLALEYHATEPFLSNEQYDDVYSKVCDYFIHEQDFRGYIVGKGWAHAVAHSADAFESLAASTNCSPDQCIEILSLVKRKFCINSYTFINGEDDRVAEVVFRIVERGLLSKHIISDWIKQFSGTTYSNSYPEDDILRTNT